MLFTGRLRHYARGHIALSLSVPFCGASSSFLYLLLLLKRVLLCLAEELRKLFPFSRCHKRPSVLRDLEEVTRDARLQVAGVKRLGSEVLQQLLSSGVLNRTSVRFGPGHRERAMRLDPPRRDIDDAVCCLPGSAVRLFDLALQFRSEIQRWQLPCRV